MTAGAADAPTGEDALGLFAGLPRRYDLLANLLSFGLDPSASVRPRCSS